MSATFNVTDLSPFEFADYDQVDSRTNPFQEGENDVIMDSTTQVEEPNFITLLKVIKE